MTGSGFRPARRARPGQAEHGSSSSRTHLMLFGGSIREQSRCPVGVGVAEQFLHSSHVLVHRRAQKVHHERLEHPAEENRVGLWLRVVSNTISTGGAISISPSVRAA